MTDFERERIITELKKHAQSFLDSGLWAYMGYFPNNFYGKEGERYYKWSQHAYKLIAKLDKAQTHD